MIKISPSIMTCDFSSLREDIRAAEEGGAEYLHLDIMDGVFVPNISFGIPVVKSLRAISKMVFDVHLMITSPINYIEEFARAGADIITFHYESCFDRVAVIDKIKACGKKAGIAIRPNTKAEAIFEFLPKLDMVLQMSVEPGFGGQKFMPQTMENVAKLKREIDARGLKVDIEVDGGINASTAPVAIANGVNVLVAGSAVFNSSDIPATIKALRSGN